MNFRVVFLRKRKWYFSRLKFFKKTESKVYKIQILDFGFIKWLDNNNNYSDSNFVFSGIEITDDINISDTNFLSNTNLDKFRSESNTYSFLLTRISIFIDSESKIQFIRSNKIGFNFCGIQQNFMKKLVMLNSKMECIKMVLLHKFIQNQLLT